MIYKRIGLIAVAAALVMGMTACGTNANDPADELDRHINGARKVNDRELKMNGQSVNIDGGNGDNLHTRNDTMLNSRDIDKQNEQLLQQVRNVDGVNDATLFVNGNDIVVGLDVDNNGNGTEVEQNVKQMLQDNQSGYTVHVTSDAQMHDRIRQIKGQMVPMDGHPIRNMAQDIATLLEDMGRMVTEPLR